MVITSRANAKVKEVRRLLQRRGRDEGGRFLAEGWRPVSQALRMGADVSQLVVAEGALGEQSRAELSVMLKEREIPVLEVTAEVFGCISPQGVHEGIAAVVGQRWERIGDVEPAKDSWWVALSEVKHPGSLGTVLRICDAVGAAGVILIGSSTDPYDPTAVRTSLGAVLWQRLVKAEFHDFAEWKRRHGCCAVGTSPAAERDYRGVCYRTPLVMLMGSERTGLSREQESICDLMVRIPMAGRCESHHVAVATGIVMYEVFTQLGGESGDSGRHGKAGR